MIARATRCLVIAAVLSALASPLIAQAGDPLAGTWVLNVAKSKFAGAAPTKQTTTLRAVDGGLYERVERVNADGTTTRWELTARYDGKDYPVVGDPARDTVALTRVDRRTVDLVNKKAGTVVSRMRIVVAADGKSRTNAVMDPSGQQTTALLAFDRQ